MRLAALLLCVPTAVADYLLAESYAGPACAGAPYFSYAQWLAPCAQTLTDIVCTNSTSWTSTTYRDATCSTVAARVPGAGVLCALRSAVPAAPPFGDSVRLLCYPGTYSPSP